MDNLLEEIRIALHGIWSRRWIALLVAWGVCLAGWLVVSQIPNRYESRARIFVQLRQILPGNDVANEQAQQRDIDRVRQTLTSAVSLQKVVRGTDLSRTVSNERDVADRVAGLQKAIKITAQQDNLFEITVTAGDSRLAKQIAQKMIDIFVESNLADNRDASNQSMQFLEAQLEARQLQLQDAEIKRADFQSRYLGSLPGTGTLPERIGAARAQLSQIDSDLASAKSALNAVNAQIAGTPANVPGTAGASVVGPARARLAALQGQLAEARSRGWTDSHPDVVALKSQLAQATTAARNEPVSGAGSASNPLYLSLRSMQADRAATVAALVQRKNQIEGDLATLQAKIDQAPGAAAEQGQIEREYQVLKDQYDKLLADREALKVTSQAQSVSDTVKFNVIDPPTQPRFPSAPNRPLLLTGVLIAGLGAAVALAFALSKLKTTFSTAARLERASGMPVIGSISEVVTEAQAAVRRRNLKLFFGGTAALGIAYLGLVSVDFIQRSMGV